MSRKSKVDPALKVELVEKYLNGEISMSDGSRMAGFANSGLSTLKTWINIYKSEGPTGLLDQPTNRYYSKETKLAAVIAYLNGEEKKSCIIE